MISIAEAQGLILAAVSPLTTEEAPLLAAFGRVVAEDLKALWDIPLADYSAMDGYTFASSSGAVLQIDSFLPAGATRSIPVPPGSAVKIMTGAIIPPGCDTVVPIEDTEVHGERLLINSEVRAGLNIRLRGEDVIKGDLVIPAGTLLRPAEIGMLASLGRAAVTVVRRPKAAVLATGDELIEAGMEPAPGQVVNSNSYSISAHLLDSGADPLPLGIARDAREVTLRKLEEGLAADLLITTGGVSVGDRDLVKELLVELGGEIKFWQVSMNPGKRPHLVRGAVELTGGRYRVISTGNQSSGRISSLTRSNGLMILAPNASLAAGEDVDVQLLDRSFEMGILTP